MKRSSLSRLFFAVLLIVGLLVCWVVKSQLWQDDAKIPDSLGGRIAEAAMWQIDKTTSYNPAYVKLNYPMGDVPLETGVCTDVVIRSLRRAVGFDLQQLVHEDMKINFSVYPEIWGLKRPDKNIDHRRVPNLRAYFGRAGYALPVTHNPDDYQAGDIVTCKLPHGRDHIMVVSYQKSWQGTPLTVHNAGGGTGQNDCLFKYKLTGHYRLH